MASRWAYLQQFLRAPGAIGAVTPSSQALAAAVADQVDFDQARTIVEYGPGTGVLTRELLRRLAPGGRLVAIELNPAFVAHLEATLHDPRLTVVRGSASNVASILQELGVGRADAVISALPFATMPVEAREAILLQTRAVLAPNGVFVAVQYLPFALLPLLRQRFRSARIAHLCLRNLPPALVMVATDGPVPREPRALQEAGGLLAAATLVAVALGVVQRWLGLMAALAIPALLTLYRDPERRAPRPLPPGAVLAPGEGRVVYTGSGRDRAGRTCVELRIFLALWDVHVQRAPIGGVVRNRDIQPGRFLPAFLSRAGDTNQRTTLVIEGDDITCEVVQVAGLLARRIVTWVQPGERVRPGARIGMIKLGSQVILRLPAHARLLVREGQHVRAGEDVVALV